MGEDALIAAVTGCWASLWTDRAISYRGSRSIRPPEEVGIAVVVQAMVDADVAGVMFSADPVTGRRDRIVLDASPGLGEAVVSGRVTPEHYILTGRGHLREWTPGGHETLIRAAPGEGTTETRGEPGHVGHAECRDRSEGLDVLDMRGELLPGKLPRLTDPHPHE